MTNGGYCLSAKKLNILNIMNQLNNKLIILCAFLFSLVIFSCNRDEPATVDKLTNQQTELRTDYCDGQVATDFQLLQSYNNPDNPSECCVTLLLPAYLNACWAKLEKEDTILTWAIQVTPGYSLNPVVNNKVTFCGTNIGNGPYILYFTGCDIYNHIQYGCMELRLENLNCK